MKVKDGGVVDGDDVAARTRLPHDFLVGTRRGVLHPVWDNMRFKASIQNITTFTSTFMPTS
jgi:hypothetical protein